MADETEFDQQARRLAKIMGDSLGAHLANAEYQMRRGADNAESLALLRRAAQLRAKDAS